MLIMPENRDLTIGTATAGGNLVPTDFYGSVVATLEAGVGAFNVNARILQTDSGVSIEVPTVTGYTAVAQVAEANAVGSETDPAFGLQTLTAYKFMGFTQASKELVADSGVNLEGYLGEMLGDQIARGLDKQLCEGDGTTEPVGIFVGFSAAVTAASASVTLDKIIDLVHSVNDGYRAGSYFLMKDSTVAAVRKLKDLNDNYLWQPSNIPGVPATLLGYPVVSDAFAPAIGTGLKSIAFGNFNKGLMIRVVNGVEVTRSDDFAFSTDLVSWKAVLRADSIISDSSAVKLLVHS
jgi:HK97 family phage major capsid protein